MQRIESIIGQAVIDIVKNLYGNSPDNSQVQLQHTRKDITGDITLVVFPLLKFSKKSPDQTAQDIGNALKDKLPEISGFEVIKGFLNIEISHNYWNSFLYDIFLDTKFGQSPVKKDSPTVMVEYSSPNTNKPLHLGHIRNNLLGFSIAKILAANGNNIIKVNLVNDRGIHICKSMLAWMKFGNGATPEKTKTKGDHLVGDYYVRFDKEYKKQIESLKTSGKAEDIAAKEAPILKEAQEMLRKWEANDKEVITLWKTMNEWVYKGFSETYKALGVNFDRIYYESETYLLGKELILEGLKKGILYKKDDGSIWADLTEEGLDHKVLLRSDGTSVYMTQDVGTAHQRFTEYPLEKLIYVVGNEQNYHFQALKIVLKKLGFSWADKLYHLSYGMVELPEGKMKSREGTVVDADDLIDEMIITARQMSQELGKLEGLDESEKESIVRIIGLGALKYYILKVDPKKSMTFDPKESIDFNGNTGPFIQYTYARICSVLRKGEEQGFKINANNIKLSLPNDKEEYLIKLYYQLPEIIEESGKTLNPALIANFCYELAKEYNQFYHEYPILKEENSTTRDLRLALSVKAANILNTAMGLLGIEMPERM